MRQWNKAGIGEAALRGERVSCFSGKGCRFGIQPVPASSNIWNFSTYSLRSDVQDDSSRKNKLPDLLKNCSIVNVKQGNRTLCAESQLQGPLLSSVVSTDWNGASLAGKMQEQ